MSKWPLTKIGKFLTPRQITPDPKKISSGEFSIVSKISFASGQIEIRDHAKTNTNMITIMPGDLVVSGINAGKGAIAIYGMENKNPATATIHYSSYEVNSDLSDIEYLWFFFRSEVFREILRLGLPNGIKTELRPNKFIALEIPLPPLPEQKRIVKKIKEIEEKTKSLAKQNDLSFAGADSIIDSYVEKIILVNDKWQRFPLKQKAKINPSKAELNGFGDSKEVSFLPMPAVDDKTGTIKAPLIKKYSEVKSGYTYFRDGDVIFAKITPCMENGKSAVCKNLVNAVGFGSTEFHVIRPDTKELLPEWVHLIVRSKKFREEAEKNMPGTAGQKRVPKEFLEDYLFPVPDITEQKAIIEHANKLIQKQDLLKMKINNRGGYILALTPSVLAKAFNGEL
jgi:restriction endonuclease S subunit